MVVVVGVGVVSYFCRIRNVCNRKVGFRFISCVQQHGMHLPKPNGRTCIQKWELTLSLHSWNIISEEESHILTKSGNFCH